MERFLATYHQQTLAVMEAMVATINELVTEAAANATNISTLDGRLDSIAAVAALEIDISPAYVEAEVQSVADKIDEVIAAAV